VTEGKSLCVFCGSAAATAREHQDAARLLGTSIGRSRCKLVYGGGRVGLMGILADAALAAGAHVTGVIPLGLHDREVGHVGITEMIVVRDMQERKRRIFELADAVAVLPGGLGTLDEAFEAITLSQLGLWVKPIVLVDIGGFWAPLLALIDHVINAGFARPEVRSRYRVVDDVGDVIPACFSAR
jgi:uncharacterized protein (TIGR00730 family)